MSLRVIIFVYQICTQTVDLLQLISCVLYMFDEMPERDKKIKRTKEIDIYFINRK